MRTLAQVIAAAANADQEPRRGQPVLLDGREVRMLCCLTLTAVLEVDGERCLVPLTRINVRRPSSLRWQTREELMGNPTWINRRRYQAAQAKAAKQDATKARSQQPQPPRQVSTT